MNFQRKCRRTAVFLTLAQLAALFAGCGSEGNPPAVTDKAATESTTPAETEDPAFLHELPEGLDFEGAVFDILTYPGSNSGNDQNYLDVDTETGDVVNDAGYARTVSVEELLNVDIVAHETDTPGRTLWAVSESILADEQLYDMIYPHGVEDLTSALTQNLMYDMRDVPHINFDKGYYAKDAIDTFSAGGKINLFAGSYPYPAFPTTYYIYNIDRWAEYKLPDPYELVRNGEWTHDKMMELLKNTYRDLDGDSERDLDDFYGMYTVEVALQYLYPAYGGSTVTSGKDGFTFGYGEEKAAAVIDRILELAADPNVLPAPGDWFTGGTEWDVFRNGNALLCLYASSLNKLRTLNFDFGFLPIPKLDEKQEKYLSFQAWGLMFCPSNITETEMIGATIEALFAESYARMPGAVQEAYVEQKLLSDEGSIEMYYRIINPENNHYDFSAHVDPTGQMMNFAPVYTQILRKENFIASDWARLQPAAEQSFGDLFTAMAGE